MRTRKSVEGGVAAGVPSASRQGCPPAPRSGGQAIRCLRIILLPSDIITIHHTNITGIAGGGRAGRAHVHRLAALRSGAARVGNDIPIVHHTRTTSRPRRTNADTADHAHARPTLTATTNVGEVAAGRSAKQPHTKTAVPGRPGLRSTTTPWHPVARPSTTTPPPTTGVGRPR